MRNPNRPAARGFSIRVLLLADTHCGFDLPVHPRVQRRRRGHDFQVNFRRSLEPALRGEVDLVVHGGDLFYRARLPPSIIELGLGPLVKVAERGLPVFLVPGNHERARIPRHLWAAHPNLHIFETPCTFTCRIQGRTVALSGFPFVRQARHRFIDLVRATGHAETPADLKLLCAHIAFEGAQVGVQNYTFRRAPDVVRGADIPEGFAAVLSGHIHRGQVLTDDLSGRPLAAPVIYPGSVEPASFAEREERKGCFILNFEARPGGQGRLTDLRFHSLPTRTMVEITLRADGTDRRSLLREAADHLRRLDPHAVVRVRWALPDAHLSPSDLRALAPPEMNIEIPYARPSGDVSRPDAAGIGPA
jgi:exonuclease SbcD